MKPEGGDVLGFGIYNFSASSTGNEIKVSHLSAYKDDYALVVVQESEAPNAAAVEAEVASLSVADIETALEENNEENVKPPASVA